MKAYANIGNISLNFEHWAAKGEEAFIKYFTSETDGKLNIQTYSKLFERRNAAQRVELLKQHFAIIKSAVGSKSAPETVNGKKGDK